MGLPKPIQERLEDLELFTDRADRIDALVEIGGEYKNFSESEVPRTPQSRVPGCESEVFFRAEPLPGGGQRYLFAVDNPQGISAMALAMILSSASGSNLSEVAAIDDEIVFRIFGRELSMGKSLGLINMVRMMKRAALQELSVES